MTVGGATGPGTGERMRIGGEQREITLPRCWWCQTMLLPRPLLLPLPLLLPQGLGALVHFVPPHAPWSTLYPHMHSGPLVPPHASQPAPLPAPFSGVKPLRVVIRP